MFDVSDDCVYEQACIHFLLDFLSITETNKDWISEDGLIALYAM